MESNGASDVSLAAIKQASALGPLSPDSDL